jgi:hypothetical protein
VIKREEERASQPANHQIKLALSLSLSLSLSLYELKNSAEYLSSGDANT